jgi:hypothetical protein
MRRLVLSLVAGAAMAAASAANATSFVGTTGGCFGNLNNSPPSAPCAPTASATLGTTGLSFSAGGFSVSDSNGFAGIGSGGGTNTLGFLTLLPGSTTNFNGTPFTLLVNFTSPGALQGTYFSTLMGSISDGVAGGIQVNFSNPNTLSFGSGADAFTLTVNNVAVSNDGVRTPITGFILTAVPEPATWALMLLGFGGIGLAMRRRRQPALAQVA